MIVFEVILFWNKNCIYLYHEAVINQTKCIIAFLCNALFVSGNYIYRWMDTDSFYCYFRWGFLVFLFTLNEPIYANCIILPSAFIPHKQYHGFYEILTNYWHQQNIFPSSIEPLQYNILISKGRYRIIRFWWCHIHILLSIPLTIKYKGVWQLPWTMSVFYGKASIWLIKD